MRRLWVGFVAGFVCLSVAGAQEDEKKEDVRFEKMKKLEGEWIMLDKEGKKTEGVTLRYRVTAAGSTVMETIFVDQPHEMVTMYHMDGEKLRMTHYCAHGNQPTLVAADKVDEKKSLSFTCDKVSNVKSHDDEHMHSLVLTFVDDDRIKQAWAGFKDGKAKEPHVFQFVRKKK